MCLSIVYSEDDKLQYLKRLRADDKGYATVYKVVRKKKGKYHPLFWNIYRWFRTGLDKDEFEYPGYHFFTRKKVALQSSKHGDTVIKCKIKKAWVNAVGKQTIHCLHAPPCDAIALTAKQAVFPSPNTKTAVVKG